MIRKNFRSISFIVMLLMTYFSSIPELRAQIVPPPTLVAPENGAANLALPILLVWEFSGTAVYRVQVSKNAAFTDLVIDVSSITNTYYELNSLTGNTSYYWRVNATILITSDWSDVWNFITAPDQVIPQAPSLNSPPNGSIDVQLNPTLSWQNISGADYYRLQVAEDTGFNNIVFNDSNLISTSKQIGPLDESTLYYWRVNARNEEGTGNWSAVWNFTTEIVQTIPSTPLLTSPPDGTTDESYYPILNWQNVSNANFYRLQLSKNQTFTNIVYNDSTITFAYQQVGPLEPATLYYWRVNARNSNGTSSWSEVWNFTTLESEILVPFLLSPADGLSNLPLSTLCLWDTVPGSALYQIQLSVLPDFSSTVIDDTTSKTYFQLEGLSSYTTYFWRARAKVNNQWHQYAAAWRFTTRLSSPEYINIDTTISFPFYEDISNYKSSDYKIIGIPGTSFIPVTTFLNGMRGSEWMAYWDNGNPNNYLVTYNESEFFYSIGKAFWIINRGVMRIETTIESTPLNSRGNAELPLHNGWNQITNPFTYPVSWDSISAFNSLTEPIFSFNGSYEISDRMLPYNGYYFFNSGNLPLIEIPPEASSDHINNEKNYSAKFSGNGNWQVNLKVGDGEYVDSLAWFGVSSLVNNEQSDLNFHKPRNWGDVPVIYFLKPEWDENYPTFATDIRPVFDSSSEWTFELRSLVGKQISIEFNLNQLPDQFDIYLYNPVSNKWIDVKDKQDYTITLVPTRSKTSFKIIVGEDIHSHLIEPEKTDFALGYNFPNPFNSSTTIPITIPEKSEVEISIFNVLGNQVKTIYKGTLDSGEHLFNWNGTDDNGKITSSGVYFYRLTDKSKIIGMKKMLLIK